MIEFSFFQYLLFFLKRVLPLSVAGSMVIGKIDDRMPSRKRGSCNNDDDDDSAKPTDIPDANIDRKRKVAWLHRKLVRVG